MRLAAALRPIGLFLPTAKRASREVERAVAVTPVSWVVPIRAGERISCVVLVEAPIGGRPNAVEFGKMLLANRLQAGLSRLGYPTNVPWERLRLLSYVEPPLEILPVQTNTNGWR
jgi:hypothetical protein